MHSLLKKNLFLFLLLCYCTIAAGQEWNSARISMLSGGSISLNFNTMEKIINGIELNNTMIYGITLSDKNIAGHELQGFTLYCRAFNGQTNIQGEANTLPLNYISIKAENESGLSSGTSYDYVSLSSGWMPLFEYTNIGTWTDLTWDTHQLSISLKCNPLVNEKSDYYSVEIEFELVPTGVGF